MLRNAASLWDFDVPKPLRGMRAGRKCRWRCSRVCNKVARRARYALNDKPDPWKSHPAGPAPSAERADANARRSDRPPRPEARVHSSPDTSMLAEGSRFGGYVVGPCIGEGGMARVYRAQHEGLQRQVALKVLLDGHGKDG